MKFIQYKLIHGPLEGNGKFSSGTYWYPVTPMSQFQQHFTAGGFPVYAITYNGTGSEPVMEFLGKFRPGKTHFRLGLNLLYLLLAKKISSPESPLT